jgi:HAD superfamily hydrolase (TIGR01490 family)
MKQLSAFDLDKTLLKQNSSFQFGLYLYKHSYISLNALLFILGCHVRHSIGLLTVKKLHETAFQYLFKGRSIDEVQQWAENFIEDNLDQLIYPPAIKALKDAQQSDHLTVIISSSPRFLVEPIANKLGADLWKSTEYAIDNDRRFCHIARIILGEDKAQYMLVLSEQHQILRQNTKAYSDSHLDLPFLLSAGSAIGVNPCRKLRATCKKYGWPII